MRLAFLLAFGIYQSRAYGVLSSVNNKHSSKSSQSNKLGIHTQGNPISSSQTFAASQAIYSILADYKQSTIARTQQPCMAVSGS